MNVGRSLRMHVCLYDQPPEQAQRQLQFYFDDATTFQLLRRQAADAIELPLDDVVLKDLHGAIYPPKRRVVEELHEGGKKP
eukprot:5990093-Prymnesium_polylepis.1